MSLPDIKALKELLKLLRSQGVLQFQSADLNLVLSESMPLPPLNRKAQKELMEEMEEDPQDEIERLIDYSSRPPVEDI